MAYGDVNYEIVKSASIVYETTGLSQAFLLTDNSLSNAFAMDEVLFVDVELMNANAFRISPSSLSNDSGLILNASSSNKPLKPMKVRNIINLAVYNAATSANASVTYTFWRRNP